MEKTLHLLMVEDSESDVFLLQRTLEKGGYKVSCEVVDTPGGMRSALQRKKNWDVITSDHAMPKFCSTEALALAKELCPEVPFIILSGEIDINLAVSLMKAGANDYIQKKEMALIVPAIERALEDVELRQNQERTSLALNESENRFKEVLENSLVASYKRNIKTNTYDYISPVITQITGYAPKEMNNFPLETVLSLFQPDDLVEVNRLLSEAMSGKNGSAITVDYRFKHKKGHYVWLEDKYSVMRDADETPTALIGSVSDITERKNMEKAIQAEKANLEKAQHIAHIGSWEWDMFLNKVDWSMEMYRIFDIDPETYDGKPESLLKVIHPDDIDIFTNSMNINLETGNSPSLDYRVVHRDGSVHTIHAEGKVEFDPNGTPTRSIGTVQDITERKRAEEALRESEEKFKKLHETAGVGIGYYTPDGVVISYNNLASRHMGGTPEDFNGRSIYDLFPKAAADMYMERIQKAVYSEEIQEYEDMVDLPRDEKWFLSTFTRILNSSGEVLGIQIISSDITKRKQEEESLRESDELFRTMFESSFVGIGKVGLDGKFLKINDTLSKILGYTKQELLQKKFDDITYEEDKGKSETLYSQLLSGKTQADSLEKRYVRKDRKVIWAFLSIAAIHDDSGKIQYFITYIQDITEEKLADNKLRESESRLGKMISNISDVIGILDENAKIIFKSSNIEKYFGWRPEDLIGSDGWKTVHPDDLDRIKQDFFQVVTNVESQKTVNYQYLCKDGSYKWIELTAMNLVNDPLINSAFHVNYSKNR
ncbi:MAG: PAS domain S-box protein [Labilibaculum sp.]|nr:PAS domain S-box protein [Labilibaculum sp.]MBI9060295.1 PAS domain S-box protein [Labilibaculum sp.]